MLVKSIIRNMPSLAGLRLYGFNSPNLELSNSREAIQTIQEYQI
jgi:hypothetical protein